MAPSPPLRRTVYKVVNRPLTVCGVERRLFFVGLILGASVFNLFYSLVSGLLTFAASYAFAYWSTARDPQMLRILLSAAARRRRYDPLKRSHFAIELR